MRLSLLSKILRLKAGVGKREKPVAAEPVPQAVGRDRIKEDKRSAKTETPRLPLSYQAVVLMLRPIAGFAGNAGMAWRMLAAAAC
ncbi:hypothetical protein PANT111_430003 [Pantoea brenneri]|uniref:Uncharacterized protein n=1 Tax=Pantoea brenneri TaxID=472694 RepID=A0AAX3JAW6_9GAMM|nr:hypothetical protein PANT111_430003 [Pantoea brenneri]